MALRTAARTEASRPSSPTHLHDGGNNTNPVFALEMERSKNTTNHIMKGQMDFIWSGEERDGRRKRFRERERDVDKIKLQNVTIFSE